MHTHALTYRQVLQPVRTFGAHFFTRSARIASVEGITSISNGSTMAVEGIQMPQWHSMLV